MVKEYQYVLFDLDGTITDSRIGITNSVMYALRKFGIVEEDRTKLFKFIGPPLADSFQSFYGFSEEKARLAIDYYREYYQETGLYENAVYDGMEELLFELKKAGKKLIIATSKPELFTKMILKYFYLTEYFDFVAGATIDEKRVRKDEVIAYALEQCGITQPEQVIMIGDREHDVIGAKKNGIDSVGVLFGFGSLGELEAAGADYIVETPEEIKAIVCQSET